MKWTILNKNTKEVYYSNISSEEIRPLIIDAMDPEMYNNYLDETYLEYEIENESFLPSEILEKMSPNRYYKAMQEWLDCTLQDMEYDAEDNGEKEFILSNLILKVEEEN